MAWSYIWTDFFDDVGETREAQRRAVVLKFLGEHLGKQYCYHVESLADGRRVCLVRPTYLNKGMDFQVWVVSHPGKAGTLVGMGDLKKAGSMPSHKEVFRDLHLKLQTNRNLYQEFARAVEEVASGKNPATVLGRKRFDFGVGLADDYVLKVLRWLLIEQDVTYWNHNGMGRNWNWGYLRWISSGETPFESILEQVDAKKPPPEKFMEGLKGP